LSNLTPVTGNILLATLTSQVAVYPPYSVTIEIVAVPSLIALIFPFLSTVATDGALVPQVTFLLVASSGKIVAFSWATSSSINSNLSLSNVTPVTGTIFSVTVTLQVVVCQPSSVVTAISTFPGAFAVTNPL